MISKQALKKFLKERKIPDFRAKQILQGVYKEGKNDFRKIEVLPKEFREMLHRELHIFCFSVAREVISKTGDTIKTLFKLHDGKLIEGVLMRFRDGRNSVCVSSQVGCGLKCAFCATGTMGFLRNLTAEEISDQVLYFDQFLKNESPKHINSSMLRGHGPSAKSSEKSGSASFERRLRLSNRVDHVIFMGMGEPMLNYDEVMASIRTMNDPDTLGIAARHITLSTSGVIPGIEKLTREPLQINLALSLHAPNQALREKMMPIAKAYKLEALMKAISLYVGKTHRRISYEYVMLKNINDTPALAREFGKLIRGTRCHVNLIPYNETYLGFSNAGKSRIDHFREILESYDVPVTVRVSLGQDISAACGQLSIDERVLDQRV